MRVMLSVGRGNMFSRASRASNACTFNIHTHGRQPAACGLLTHTSEHAACRTANTAMSAKMTTKRWLDARHGAGVAAAGQPAQPTHLDDQRPRRQAMLGAAGLLEEKILPECMCGVAHECDASDAPRLARAVSLAVRGPRTMRTIARSQQRS